MREKIDQGLAGSKFGVVVLSNHFFEKEWPRRELNGLVAREIDGAKVILPLWHGVIRDEVARYSPTLADRVAVDTSLGLSHVANKILEVVRPSTDWADFEDWIHLLEYMTNHKLNEVTNSPQFLSQYPPDLSASQFVDKLCDDLDRNLSQGVRSALVAGMTAGVFTRAQVLRQVTNR